MSIKADQDSAERILHLIQARQADDIEKVNEIGQDLVQTPEDAYALAIVLARHVAQPLIAIREKTGTYPQVQFDEADHSPQGAALVAVQAAALQGSQHTEPAVADAMLEAVVMAEIAQGPSEGFAFIQALLDFAAQDTILVGVRTDRHYRVKTDNSTNGGTNGGAS